ncbi:hypothetical protein ACS0TY_018358 [Phlomoides rotata]
MIMLLQVIAKKSMSSFQMEADVVEISDDSDEEIIKIPSKKLRTDEIGCSGIFPSSVMNPIRKQEVVFLSSDSDASDDNEDLISNRSKKLCTNEIGCSGIFPSVVINWIPKKEFVSVPSEADNISLPKMVVPRVVRSSLTGVNLVLPLRRNRKTASVVNALSRSARRGKVVLKAEISHQISKASTSVPSIFERCLTALDLKKYRVTIPSSFWDNHIKKSYRFSPDVELQMSDKKWAVSLKAEKSRRMISAGFSRGVRDLELSAGSVLVFKLITSEPLIMDVSIKH